MAALRSLIWRLASPYDAYLVHVSRLNEYLRRIEHLTEQALALEAGLLGSVRVVPSERRAEQRLAALREQLSRAAAEMTDEEFEQFVAHLGGGEPGKVEEDRQRMVARLESVSRHLEEYFRRAADELRTLERRRYDPRRRDVARELRENGLPPLTLAEYRHRLRDLGARVGKRPV